MNDSKLSPFSIIAVMIAYRQSQTLCTALHYDIFTHIANGAHTLPNLIKLTNTDIRVTKALLDALVAMDFLKKKKGNYYLLPISQTFLVRGEPEFLGNFCYPGLWAYESMAHLKEVMKTGKPVKIFSLDTPDDKYWEGLALGLSYWTKILAKGFCKIMEDNKFPKGIKVLDLGGGSGIFAATLLKYDPTISFTQLDVPQVNKLARKFLASQGIEKNKVTFIDADIRDIQLPKESFDLVILSNVCHHEDGPGNIKLFKKAFDALVHNGQVAIADFIVNNDYTGPRRSLLFTIMMVATNPRGGAFSFQEYKSWLIKAGFQMPNLYTSVIPEEYEGPALIVAKK